LHTGIVRLIAICFFSTGVGFSEEVSFYREVMAVLSKAGCNGGACHGNQNGKGGFKLSLWGENPRADFKALHSRGRVNTGDHTASKLLLKPTLQLKHEGKKRFGTSSVEYRILLDWIRSGAKEDTDNAPRLESLSVSPKAAMLTAPENSLALKVTAAFSDGGKRDVTRWAVYETSSLIAEANPAGVVEFAQLGETTVFVRYLSGRASMRVGMIRPRTDFRWSGPEPANVIDQHVFAKLKQFQENPAEPCNDATFIRRAYLDITGTLPDPREAETFVNDSDPGKRDRLIDRLLASPGYAEYWALKWADLLRVEEKTLDARGVETFHNWIRNSLATGKPLDTFAREVLSSTGSTYGNPPTNFYRALRLPVDRAEAAAQVFLGSRLKCARCHDHPFEDVRQDDYYRFAALFDGIDYEIIENKRKDGFDKHQFRGEQKVKLVALDKLDPKNVLKHPRTKKPPQPGLLDRDAPPLVSFNRRLEQMAEWVTSHPNFAKVQANRIWFHMMGRALIEPVDDVRDTNPPSNPALMDALERELRRSGHNPRHLIRLIANSKTYQFSAEPHSGVEGSEENFARATVRRHPAEVLLDAAHGSLDGPIEFADAHKSKRSIGMPGVESVHLSRNPGHGERFLKLFGKPARLTNSDAERNDDTTLAQVFELTGGETLNRLLRQNHNRIGQQIRAGHGDGEIIDTLYWAILTRAPSARESNAMLRHLATADDRRGALEDVAWGLLNAKEFMLRR
jgi:hypothetical protein